jgi:hypothetical protein
MVQTQPELDLKQSDSKDFKQTDLKELKQKKGKKE